MIGVQFNNIETYNNFINFREQWYLDTKMVFTKKDIASKVDYVISDMQIPNTNTNMLIFGEDIKRFEELSNYTQLVRSGSIKSDEFMSQLDLLENLEVDVSIADELVEDFDNDFKGYQIDTDKFMTPEATAKRLEEQRQQLEKLKRKREQEILLEQERIKQEEFKRQQEEEERLRKQKEEQERLEREKQAELERQRIEQERLKAEELHKLELEKIAKEREIAIALEQKRQELELQQKELEAQKELAQIEAQSRNIQLAKSNVITQFDFKEPVIPESLLPAKQSTGRLKIGGKKNSLKSNIYIVGSTMADSGGTTVAFNLAYSLKKNAEDVLLIDLDFLSDKIDQVYSLEDSVRYSIDKAFTEDYVDFIRDIQYNVARIIQKDREISILTSLTYDNLSAQDARLLDNYNFSTMLKSLSMQYKNIVVDIGSMSSAKQYQKLLLLSKEFKKVMVYNGESQTTMNECVNCMSNILGDWNIVLTKASKSINTITVEKTLGKRVLGVLPLFEDYYDDKVLMEKHKNAKLASNWSEITKMIIR